MITQTELPDMPPSTMPEGKTLVEVFADEEKAAKKKKSLADRCRGVINADVGGEKYNVRMRAAGIYVKKNKKRHLDFVPMWRMIDFVTGQAQLPLGDCSKPNPDYVSARYESAGIDQTGSFRMVEMWALIKSDGSVITGSDIESESDAWRIGLGWPSPEEIEHHKANGCYAALVMVKIPNNANS